jgi:2-methylcitrate dehydratase PrpD
METIADRIADWSCGFTLDAAPPAAVEAATRCLVDVCGVAAAGMGTEAAGAARAYAASVFAPGPCFAFGVDRGLAAPGAAFVNAVSAHALDYDDTCYLGITHPSAVVFPAAAAAAEDAGADGRALLTAFVAGIEAEAALARALGPGLYDKGWFNTAVLGVVGAAAAAARAAGLDRETTRQALRLAVVQALGVRAVQGTQAKPLTAGRASETGLAAALMARLEVDAPAMAVEGPSGLARVFNGEDADASALDALGRDFALVSPGIAFKLFPLCSAAQAAAELARDLLAELGADSGEVRRALCEVTPFVEMCLPYGVPESVAQMQFSLPFAVACALVHGTVEVGHLSLATPEDPKIRATLPKVEMRISEVLSRDEDQLRRYPEAATVTLTLADGRALTRTRLAATGMPEDPLDDDALDRKFLVCAGTVMPEARARVWLARVRAVDTLKRASEIFPA